VTRRWGGAAIAFSAVLMAVPAAAQADPNPDGLNIFFPNPGAAVAPENLSTTLTLFVILTALTLAPALLVMTTSFTRIIVVLSFLRQAMATQQSPPNQVLVGLALILTMFVMMPTYTEVYEQAILPYTDETHPDFPISQAEALERGMEPVREFLFKHTRTKDLALFVRIAQLDRPETPADIPTHVLVPAFVISELRVAFQIGFLIYIPFLIIDMVVASTLMAMGMMMLPPVFVSLPFKIIMFVLADGWYLIVGELVNSYR
jgi:flagellar biosynthetic protein FliP